MMRIIAGKYKGTRLHAPTGTTTRPTSDRARQIIFDIILHAPWAGKLFIENAIVCDMFAGTGALGLEALSRGAQKVCFFEKNDDTRLFLQKNINVCRANSVSCIYKDNLYISSTKISSDLIFLDPPYQQNLIPFSLHNLMIKGWISKKSLIITETSTRETLNLDLPFHLLSERKVGAAWIKFWKIND
ncbi:Ribosomal RNA small subunit methyltransferase D [Commensalibacter sp. Nvir]|uniref:16S rRNA (guanine(966)-N(2))-methyltransferase RsmD n=1 Tax=Commensalibacter sp. Nvir TaxID=3069817 RepID=UPI002D6D8E41|nr:Ribosomal RNA small subunit methyltransferase D [Commensalibacter sp. Nvir]